MKKSALKEVIMKKQPIGVLDSGLGGISVLKDLIAHLPHEDFLYYGLLPGIQSPESEKMLENIRQRREIKAYYASLKGE